MTEMTIAVTGLAQLNKALRAIDKDAPKALRLALNTVAEHVAGEIRPEIPVVTGAARGSIRVASTRTSARLRVGGTKAAYFPWLDFGGEGKRRGRPPRREFISEGRYVYPTLARERPTVSNMLQRVLDGVVSDSGLDVT